MEDDSDVLTLFPHIAGHRLLHQSVLLAVDHIVEGTGLGFLIMAEVKEPVGSARRDRIAVFIKNIDRLEIISLAQVQQLFRRPDGLQPVSFVIDLIDFFVLHIVVVNETGRLIQDRRILFDQVGDQLCLGEETVVVVFPDHLPVLAALIVSACHLLQGDPGFFGGLGNLQLGLCIKGDTEDKHHTDDHQRVDLFEDRPVKHQGQIFTFIQNFLFRFKRPADKIISDDNRIEQAEDHYDDKSNGRPEQYILVIPENILGLCRGADHRVRSEFFGYTIVGRAPDRFDPGISVFKGCL